MWLLTHLYSRPSPLPCCGLPTLPSFPAAMIQEPGVENLLRRSVVIYQGTPAE